MRCTGRSCACPLHQDDQPFLYQGRHRGLPLQNNPNTMATYDNLPVYKTTYDLLLLVFATVKEFQKDYKYTL